MGAFMALIDLIDLPKSGPLIGIDPGSKTLGIAASDGLRLIASPVTTIQRSKLAKDLAALFALYDDRGAVGCVIGLPLNMDGSEGPRVQDIPIAMQDERLSTAQATRAMLEADLSRARRAEIIDASAAAIILQTALDRLA